MDRLVAGNAWDAREYDEQFGFVGRYGDALLDLLDPRPGERILDLGCGTGRHAAAMTALGARVVGVDADERMLAKARADHPEVEFVAANATDPGLGSLGVNEPFAACFSNAALHWMTPQDTVLRNVRSVLADSGRFVAEMGGAGNIAALDASLRGGLGDVGLEALDVVANHFPTVGEQAALLEAAGFRVEMATWFRRPTPLAAGTTAADWTRHFRAGTWAVVPVERRDELAEAINRRAVERGLRTADGWSADYCRLRFVAIAAG